jgi:hypothetical protein
MKTPRIFQKTAIVVFTIAVILTITSCAHVTPIEECVQDEPYGFWYGLWHGIIAPISFVISLFSDEVAMYGVNNNGGWYDFGFVLGAGILFGSGGRNAKKRS